MLGRLGIIRLFLLASPNGKFMKVGVDAWCGPTSKMDVKRDYVNFLNHSCDPNTWFDGEEILVARREINTDDEITFDYATCDTNVSTFLVKV